MNEQFVKDVAKGIQQTPLNQELPAGSTPRRWEPEEGVKKLNERIHKESKAADDWKNLPFSFRKPPKAMGRNTAVKCDSCGHITHGTTATVGMICTSCGKFSTVTEVHFDG
jgi:hypothetical protein